MSSALDEFKKPIEEWARVPVEMDIASEYRYRDPVVGHDDLQAYRGMQAGLHASGNEWVSLHRDYDPSELKGGEITTGGTNELPMRNQYRSWVQRMTETM